MTSNKSKSWTTSGATGVVPICPAPTYLAPASQQLNTPLIASTLLDEPALNELTPAQNPDQGFPVRLHYMLTDISNEGVYTDIVSWQPHGRCFVVHNKKEFVDKILCLWFRQSKWASFQRQLNMYGFQRLSHGMDKGGYYHALFLQNSPHLARQIQRHKVKGNGPRRPAQPEAEPNFYAMKAARDPPPVDAQASGTTTSGCPAYSCTLPATAGTLTGATPSLSTITLRSTMGLTFLANHTLPKVSDIFPTFTSYGSSTDEQDVLALEELALFSYPD